ncbi:MAG TPA: DNA-packaging protein [Candidatus Eisenbergiella pullicola]|nr:DNA-packaging protein [Candidatus Eisenbergiella pullicola]
MAKSNFPTNGLNNVSSEFAHDTIKSLNDLYSMGRPNSDDEVEQRIDEYFRFCEQSSIRPGIESLGLALSVSRTALWNWEHGIDCSPRRQQLIVKAKSFVTAYLEQAMLNNKIYPGSAIFCLKNWAGYKDSVEITTEQSTSLKTPAMSQEEIHRIAEQVDMQSVEEMLEELPD